MAKKRQGKRSKADMQRRGAEAGTGSERLTKGTGKMNGMSIEDFKKKYGFK